MSNRPVDVPFVRFAPAADIEAACLTAPYPWGLSKVIVATPTFPEENEVETPVIILPYPISWRILSLVSLVYSFLSHQ